MGAYRVASAFEQVGRILSRPLTAEGSIELERAEPEGRQPPALPTEIFGSYNEAMAFGARIAETLIETERDPDYVRGLEAASAAMRGDLATARRLFDPDEEDM